MKNYLSLASSLLIMILFVGVGVMTSATTIFASSLVPNNAVCAPLVTDYLQAGKENDPSRVLLLQAFLKGVEGQDIELTGSFDTQTVEGVKEFQITHKDEVLSPWGLEESDATGYVYFTTRKAINEIYCERGFALAPYQLAEMNTKTYTPEVKGVQYEEVIEVTSAEIKEDLTETAVMGSVDVDDGSDDTKVISKDFYLPHDVNEMIQISLLFVLILALVYIIGSIIAELQNGVQDLAERRIQKLVYFISGVIVAAIVVSFFHKTTLIAPLIVVGIVLSIVLRFLLGKEDVTK